MFWRKIVVSDALGSVNLMLYLGLASEKKPTKKYSECIRKCFNYYGCCNCKIKDNEFKEYIDTQCGDLRWP